MEFGGAYDYIAYTETNPSSSDSTGRSSRAAVHKETVPYHSTGPSASPSDKRSSAGQPGSSSVYSDDVYKAPISQKFRVSTPRITCVHGTKSCLTEHRKLL